MNEKQYEEILKILMDIKNHLKTIADVIGQGPPENPFGDLFGGLMEGAMKGMQEESGEQPEDIFQLFGINQPKIDEEEKSEEDNEIKIESD